MRSVLLIEDALDDQVLVQRLFNVNRVANPLVVFGTGEMALNWLHGRNGFETRPAGDMPLIVLLDLGLTGKDGLEVLRDFKADTLTATIPVVIITGWDDPDEIIGRFAKELGAVGLVRKPLEWKDFTQVLRHLNLVLEVRGGGAP